MADSTDEEHLNSPTNTKSESSTDEIILTNDNETNNLNQQPIDMEVHHHPKVEKKNFKEYLLEGLMIFLAVTMGFIAENIREYISENKIANELAENLYKEVYSDSIFIQKKIEHRIKIEADCDYFIEYVKDSNLIIPSESFYNSFISVFFSLDANIFEPKDGILNQLKNSGALRYFRSNKLQEDLGEFSVALTNVRTRNEQDFLFIQSSNKPFALTHLDFVTLHEGWSAREIDKTFFDVHQDSLSAYGTPKTQALKKIYNPQILNIDRFNRVDAMNLVSMYVMVMRGTRTGRYQTYVEKNHLLLETLRNEYRVSNK